MSDDEKPDQFQAVEARLIELKQELLDTQAKLLSSQTELETSCRELSQSRRKYAKVVEANEQLRKENECLSQQLHNFKVAKKSRVAIGVQTEEWNQPAVEQYATHDPYTQSWVMKDTEMAYNSGTTAEPTETRKVGDLGEDGMPVWDVPKDDGKEETGGLSIAEGLKAAATEVLQETGVVYHEDSGLYYDYSSGYYFDPERSLYYEPHSGVYYLFDHDTQEYKFHSQVDLTLHQQDSNDNKRSKKKSAKKKKKTSAKNAAEELPRKSEEQDDRKLQARGQTSDISDKKPRKGKSKRITRTLKREDKMAATSGKNDLKPSKDGAHAKGERSRTKARLAQGHHGVVQGHRAGAPDASSLIEEARSSNPNGPDDGDGDGNNEDSEAEESREEANQNSKDEGTGDVDMVDSGVQSRLQGETPGEKGEDVEMDAECETNDGEDSESEMEEGQVLTSTDDDCEDSDTDSDTDEGSEGSAEQLPPEEESVPAHYAPCIRVMVTESDKLDVATLFMVTCRGGTIGREASLNHVITIPDLNVSKAHAGVEYREDLKKYTLSDFASQNGTFLNGHRLSEPKKMSAAFPLSHGDVILLGGTTLQLHIHPGSETCDTCEPGQVLAALQGERDRLKGEEKILTKREKEQLRRQQLKQIKRKFGLENASYIDNKDALSNPNYEDKASERRRTKGSDNPYQPDDVPASVHRPIEETNKGHKLLSKMGWKEGQGLGRAEQGVNEPVK